MGRPGGKFVQEYVRIWGGYQAPLLACLDEKAIDVANGNSGWPARRQDPCDAFNLNSPSCEDALPKSDFLVIHLVSDPESGCVNEEQNGDGSEKESGGDELGKPDEGYSRDHRASDESGVGVKRRLAREDRIVALTHTNQSMANLAKVRLFCRECW